MPLQVFWGTTAQTDQEIGSEAARAATPSGYLDRRIRLDVVENTSYGMPALLVRNVGDPFLTVPVSSSTGSVTMNALGEAMGPGDARNLLDGSAAEIRGLVENHAIDHSALL